MREAKGGREEGGGSGGLGEGEREQLGGPRPPPADRAERSGSGRHGKSPVGAFLSAGAAKHRGLCSATITATRKRTESRPSRVYIAPPHQKEITGGSHKEVGREDMGVIATAEVSPNLCNAPLYSFLVLMIESVITRSHWLILKAERNTTCEINIPQREVTGLTFIVFIA